MHSADRRRPWSQVASMFVCSILVVVIVAGIATAIPFALEEKSWGWYLLALSPGWVLSERFAPCATCWVAGLPRTFHRFLRQLRVLVRVDL